LIEKVPLATEVKILGGSIQFQINTAGEVGIEKQEQFRSNDLSPIRRKPPLKEDEEPNIDRSDFEKSFWNKSLNETKQKWAKSTQNLTDNRKRRLQELNKEEVRRKL
jgi:hypothetical protein